MSFFNDQLSTASGWIGVVCHDAGGAEVVSSLVRRRTGTFRFALDGPAESIFERKMGRVESVPLARAVMGASGIICGTSWQSDLEVEAICLARDAGVRSIAFLDHWTNYAERFDRNGATSLPDEIWVGDEIAQTLAGAAFPRADIKLRSNPYLEDVLVDLATEEVALRREGEGLRVLYVCEPVAEHALRSHGDPRFFGYVEEDALRFFMERLDALGGPVDRIVVRRHPSESEKKWAWARELSPAIRLGGASPLTREIAEADVVVGCESMALVVALMAGKRVLSCIPPGGRACGLPHPGIEHL